MGNPWDHIKASNKLIADNLYDDFVNDTPISFININDKRFKKRKGYKETSPYFRYDKYQHARTMKEAIYLGASMDDLIFDFSKDYWKLVDEKDAGVEECKEIIIHKPEIKKSTTDLIFKENPDGDGLISSFNDYDPDCGNKYGLCYVCDEEIGDGGYDYKDYPSKICKSCYDMPDPVDVKKIRELEKLNDGIMDENKRLKKLVESLMKECDKNVPRPSIKKLELENEKLKKEIEELKSDKISMASAWEEDLEENKKLKESKEIIIHEASKDINKLNLLIDFEKMETLQKNCEKLYKKNKKLEKKIKKDEPMIVYQATEIDDEISNLMKQVDLKEFKEENKRLKEENEKLLNKNKMSDLDRQVKSAIVNQWEKKDEEIKKLMETECELSEEICFLKKEKDKYEDLFKQKCAEDRRPLCLKQISEYKEDIQKLQEENKELRITYQTHIGDATLQKDAILIRDLENKNKELREENKKLKNNDDVADLLEEIQELKERISKLRGIIKKNKL